MWIMTPKYFASVVAADKRRQPAGDKRNYLMVRFRSRADLDEFIEDLGEFPLTHEVVPESTPQADYPWKVKLLEGDVRNVASRAIESIDYGNFKNEVTRQSGDDRHDTYLKVWGDLLEIEMEEDADVERGFLSKAWSD